MVCIFSRCWLWRNSLLRSLPILKIIWKCTHNVWSYVVHSQTDKERWKQYPAPQSCGYSNKYQGTSRSRDSVYQSYVIDKLYAPQMAVTIYKYIIENALTKKREKNEKRKK